MTQRNIEKEEEEGDPYTLCLHMFILNDTWKVNAFN